MDEYNSKSCNTLEKPFYLPVEAALRWCGLIKMESFILSGLNKQMLPKTSSFPRWPCLQANTEKIIDAIIHDVIPYGKDGMPITYYDEYVAPALRTVRHSDLKEWMNKNYPDQKPEFLFDDIERKTHKAIDAEAFQALQVDRDALKARTEKAEQWAKEKAEETSTLRSEINSLKAMADKTDTLDQRSETTYLNIIGGLINLILGKSPSGKKYSVYESQAAIIDGLLSHHPNKPGLKQRTLEEKFAEAKRSLNN